MLRHLRIVIPDEIEQILFGKTGKILEVKLRNDDFFNGYPNHFFSG